MKHHLCTIILGLGSPFADDQAGWLVAEQLLSLPNLQSKIIDNELIIERLDRPGLNLLSWLQKDYSKLFLIDMVKTNLSSTGNIYVLKGHEIVGFSGMLSSHGLGVPNALALSEALGIDIRNVTVWGIEGELYSPSSCISKQMEQAVQKVTKQISAQLAFN